MDIVSHFGIFQAEGQSDDPRSGRCSAAVVSLRVSCLIPLVPLPFLEERDSQQFGDKPLAKRKSCGGLEYTLYALVGHRVFSGFNLLTRCIRICMRSP